MGGSGNRHVTKLCVSNSAGGQLGVGMDGRFLVVLVVLVVLVILVVLVVLVILVVLVVLVVLV